MSNSKTTPTEYSELRAKLRCLKADHDNFKNRMKIILGALFIIELAILIKTCSHVSAPNQTPSAIEIYANQPTIALEWQPVLLISEKMIFENYDMRITQTCHITHVPQYLPQLSVPKLQFAVYENQTTSIRV